MTRRLVVDANRIYSALLRDGETRRAMMNTGALLFAPRFLRLEIERHKSEIVRRSRGKGEEIEATLAVLYRRIAWVADHDVSAHLAAANHAMGRVDAMDVPYLACALAVNADAIWSSDPDFDAQELVPRILHPDASLKRR